MPLLAPTHSPEPGTRTKPTWRGVLHQYAFFGCLLPLAVLVFAAPTAKATAATAIYAASLAALLGTSALFHRVTWSPRARFWMSRLDFAMIFVLIAGSYTPVALLGLPPPVSTLVLWTVWCAAAAGIVLKIFWKHSPKWASSIVYVVIGSVGVLFLPEISRSLGIAAVVWFAAGGAVYILGAVVYATQRPDPLPSVFGYHEIFHALVVIAAAIHYVAVVVYVLPATV